MARIVEIHPQNPQGRLVQQVVDTLQAGGLIAYPTDSGYALGCKLGNAAGVERIRKIRRLDDKHHFTLVCSTFAQLGQFVHIDNSVFRMLKAATPGPYTFILPATKEVPRRLMHPKKNTVGVRLPEHKVVAAILDAVGEPLLSSTLILPGETEALTTALEVQDAISNDVDVIVDSGAVLPEPTTAVSFVDGQAEVMRVGAGDTALFE